MPSSQKFSCVSSTEAWRDAYMRAAVRRTPSSECITSRASTTVSHSAFDERTAHSSPTHSAIIALHAHTVRKY